LRSPTFAAAPPAWGRCSRRGYAIALTDYQGLHPYLEPRTAAFNVIDAVRALRSIFPDASWKWLAYGGSQGGQAAWAADKQNAFYGEQLLIVGAVALAAAANMGCGVGLQTIAYRLAARHNAFGHRRSLTLHATLRQQGVSTW